MPLLGFWVGSVLGSTALRNGNAEISQGRNTSAETQQLFGAGERRGQLEVKGRGVTSRREALPQSQGCDGQPAVEKKNTQFVVCNPGDEKRFGAGLCLHQAAFSWDQAKSLPPSPAASAWGEEAAEAACR